MEAKTGDAKAWHIIADAERFATHDPGVAWPDGPEDNPVAAIMAALDAEREQRGNDWASPDTPLMRAIRCARRLRDYTVEQRDGGEQPFTVPVVELGSDDSVAEVEVTQAWGFSKEDLDLFIGQADLLRGELIVFRQRDGDARICASFRFVE